MHLWRLLIIFFLFLVQISIIVLGILYIRDYYPYVYLGFLVVSIIIGVVFVAVIGIRVRAVV